MSQVLLSFSSNRRVRFGTFLTNKILWSLSVTKILNRPPKTRTVKFTLLFSCILTFFLSPEWDQVTLKRWLSHLVNSALYLFVFHCDCDITVS